MSATELERLLDFLRRAERLKNVTRTSWTSAGKQESTAEHTWHMALFALGLRSWFPELNFDRVLSLVIVHDLGEAIGGDISAVLQVGAPPKVDQERRDLHLLVDGAPAAVQSEVRTLWEEYNAAATPEARFVKAVDKLTTILQHNRGRNPPDFDFAFNLPYGQAYTEYHAVIRELRAALDAETRERAAGEKPAD